MLLLACESRMLRDIPPHPTPPRLQVCSINGDNFLHFAKGWERRRKESSNKLISQHLT